jgi:uncharacterized membrane protein (UPF0182 family)
MNIKRSLILLAILVIIFLGAVIAVYPNWLWFKNLEFAPVFWTMIVARFGLVAVTWFVMIVLLVALGYHLKVYGLLYSTQGPAFGASYTDVHVRIPVFRVLMVVSLLWSFFLIYNAENWKNLKTF